MPTCALVQAREGRARAKSQSGRLRNASITAPASTDSGHYFIALGDETDQNGTLQINFGGCSGFTVSSAQADGNGYGAFEYAPPSGFYAICTKNLAEFG